MTWSGSYVDPDFPIGNIDGFIVSFFTDQPATPNEPSQPLDLVVSYFVDLFEEVPNSLCGPGCDGHLIFDYSASLLDACIIANPMGLATQNDCLQLATAGQTGIFWISIQPVLGFVYSKSITPPCEQIKTPNSWPNDFWGWHSTYPTHNFNDDAFLGTLSISTGPNKVLTYDWQTDLHWPDIAPAACQPTLFPQGVSANLAFDLHDFFGPCWDQPPCELVPIDPPADRGVDVPTGYQWTGGDKPPVNKVVADDFLSDGRRITGLRWWGSYLDSKFEPQDPEPPESAGRGAGAAGPAPRGNGGACSARRIDFGVTPDDFGNPNACGPVPTVITTQYVLSHSIVFGSAIDKPNTPSVGILDDAACTPTCRSAGLPPFTTDWWCQFKIGAAPGIPGASAGVTDFSAELCFIDGPPGTLLMEGYDNDCNVIVTAVTTQPGTETLSITAPPGQLIAYVRVVASNPNRPAGVSVDCLNDPDPIEKKPPKDIDGWLLSFHWADLNADPTCPPDLLLGDFPTVTGLYFAPEDAVQIIDTGIVDCFQHRVFQYEVQLSDCCLICSTIDPRLPGALPAQPDAFDEEEGFRYWLDIQAVVGATFVQIPDGTCVKQITDSLPSNHNPSGDFWGWHTSPAVSQPQGPLDDACVGEILFLPPAAPFCPDYGNWFKQPWLCPPPPPPVNMAFELLTPTCPCLGDINGDGILNGLDIIGLVRCLLGVPLPIDNCACADINGDNLVTVADIDLFVVLVLNKVPCP